MYFILWRKGHQGEANLCYDMFLGILDKCKILVLKVNSCQHIITQKFIFQLLFFILRDYCFPCFFIPLLLHLSYMLLSSLFSSSTLHNAFSDFSALFSLLEWFPHCSSISSLFRVFQILHTFLDRKITFHFPKFY